MSDASDSTTESQSEGTNEQSAQTESVDLNAELAKWKSESRKHETRAKENAKAAKELADLKASMMSEQEKAIANAVAEAQKGWKTEQGTKLAQAEFRALAAGRMDDERLGTLISGLNLSNFLNADGDPDADAIGSFLDGVAPKSQTLDLGQGSRGNGNGNATPLNSDDLTKSVMHALGIK